MPTHGAFGASLVLLGVLVGAAGSLPPAAYCAECSADVDCPTNRPYCRNTDSFGVCAYDAAILGKVGNIKDPTGMEERRAVIVRARSQTPPNPYCDFVVSDSSLFDLPSLRIVTTGGTPSDVTYELANDEAFWNFRLGGSMLAGYFVSYTYRNSYAGEPVKKIRLKLTPGDSFTTCRVSLAIILKGDVGTADLEVVPPNPGNTLTAVLSDSHVNRLCVNFGGAAGGDIKIDTDRGFKIAGPTSAASCPPSVGSPSGAFLEGQVVVSLDRGVSDPPSPAGAATAPEPPSALASAWPVATGHGCSARSGRARPAARACSACGGERHLAIEGGC